MYKSKKSSKNSNKIKDPKLRAAIFAMEETDKAKHGAFGIEVVMLSVFHSRTLGDVGVFIFSKDNWYALTRKGRKDLLKQVKQNSCSYRVDHCFFDSGIVRGENIYFSLIALEEEVLNSIIPPKSYYYTSVTLFEEGSL